MDAAASQMLFFGSLVLIVVVTIVTMWDPLFFKSSVYEKEKEDEKPKARKTVYEYNFPELLKERYMKERNKTEQEFELVQLALKDWFSIFEFNTRGSQFYDFPSSEVDELWHMFILFTKDYREFCEEYLGQFLDHVPLSEENTNNTNLKNLMATFKEVRLKNKGLLFKIDETFKIKKKYNYNFMQRLYDNLRASNRSVADADELCSYGLISSSQRREAYEYADAISSSSSKSSIKSSSSDYSSSYDSSISSSSSSKSSCGS